MGPLPAFFYPAFQLMDYGVHSWDVRQGTGRAHGLVGDAADLLTPFMFVLWQYTTTAAPTASRARSGSGSRPARTPATRGSPSAARGCTYDAGRRRRPHRARVRPRQLRADRLRPQQRRHDPRRARGRRPLPQPLLPDLRSRHDRDRPAGRSRPSASASARRTSSPRPTARPRRRAGCITSRVVCSDVERDRAVLPGGAGVPADRDLREPGLPGVEPLLLRHRQRQPARLLRLPGPRRRPVRRGAGRPAPHRDLGGTRPPGSASRATSTRPASTTRARAARRSTSATPTARGSS